MPLDFISYAALWTATITAFAYLPIPTPSSYPIAPLLCIGNGNPLELLLVLLYSCFSENRESLIHMTFLSLNSHFPLKQHTHTLKYLLPIYGLLIFCHGHSFRFSLQEHLFIQLQLLAQTHTLIQMFTTHTHTQIELVCALTADTLLLAWRAGRRWGGERLWQEERESKKVFNSLQFNPVQYKLHQSSRLLKTSSKSDADLMIDQ